MPKKCVMGSFPPKSTHFAAVGPPVGVGVRGVVGVGADDSCGDRGEGDRKDATGGSAARRSTPSVGVSAERSELVSA